MEIRNSLKVKTLTYLKECFNSGRLAEHFAWRTPAEMAMALDVNGDSLRVILKRWRSNSWGYVDGKYFTGEQTEDSRPHWFYKINNKGLAYMARLPKWYKSLDELATWWSELDEDGCQTLPFHKKGLKSIGWHIAPSEMVTVIRWPFQTAVDTYSAFGFSEFGIRCESLKEAAGMARAVFHVEPSVECLTQAKAYQDEYVEAGLKKLASDAGFATH